MTKTSNAEVSAEEFKISRHGKPTIDSPLTGHAFVDDDARVLYDNRVDRVLRTAAGKREHPSFDIAGPRRKLFFEPANSRAAVLTAGGLCPGLNEVIKFLTITLKSRYGVPEVYGVPYGYRGLNPAHGLLPVKLTPESVDSIHENGGTVLGSSRGSEDPAVMVDTLIGWGVNMLFCIGGDGTARGCHAIAGEIARRRLPISVIAIPKTIDNDIGFIDSSFGFATAVLAVGRIITCAHNEAKGAYNGIGLIKVMGRDSGFIAATASLANPFVNYCLIPEDPFTLEKGPRALLPHLKRRLAAKHHAVIIVAEGAGQEFFNDDKELRDASGNLLKKDIGLFLKSRIGDYCRDAGIEVTVKYFDPGYQIRSVQAEGEDAVFCALLAQNAVHAALSGRTDVMIGHWDGSFTHVPIQLATRSRKKVDLQSQLWQGVRNFTCF